MERQLENRIVLVTRETRLDELVARYNTIAQAKFYIEHLGGNFADCLAEHRQYERARAKTIAVLQAWGRVQIVQRRFLPNFLFGPDDLVVALGPDGLVANTLKYLDHQPLVGVNPDPDRWDGILLPFRVGDLKSVVPAALNADRPLSTVSMAQVELADGQRLYAVNDFFIGARTHVSARYVLRFGDRVEAQSSSGIIVSTGLGASGWLSSVLTGAVGIANQVALHPFQVRQPERIPWDAEYLYYSVREPFPSRSTGTSLIFGKITRRRQLLIESQMPGNGVIFSDGIEADYLPFNAGMGATISVADKQGCLVV